MRVLVITYNITVRCYLLPTLLTQTITQLANSPILGYSYKIFESRKGIYKDNKISEALDCVLSLPAQLRAYPILARIGLII